MVPKLFDIFVTKYLNTSTDFYCLMRHWSSEDATESFSKVSDSGLRWIVVVLCHTESLPSLTGPGVSLGFCRLPSGGFT